MTQNRHKQLGMTGLGWLTVLFLIGFFAMLIIKLAPIYIGNHSVKSTVESLREEPLVTRKSVAEIRKIIQRRLNINYVNHLKKDDIKIKKKGGVLDVEISYEVREPIVGNIDVVVYFTDKITLVTNN